MRDARTLGLGRPNVPALLVVLCGLAFAPIVLRDRFYLHILIIAMVWSIVAATWDLVLGYGGMFSWGQMALFTVGAYSTGMVTISLGLSPWSGLVAGAVFAGLVGLVLGLATLRLTGVQVGLITFAVHLTLGPLIQLGKGWGTGGYLGLLGIPSPGIGGYVLNPLNLLPWYFIAWMLLTLSSLLIVVFLRSTRGLALMAIRDSQPFAQSLGISAHRLKLGVFVASAVLTGLAGAFYAEYTSSISPRLLGLDIFLTLTAMLVIGGIGRFPGAIIGAIVASVVTELLRPLEDMRLLVFGGVVVVAVILMPSGLMGVLELGQAKIRLLLGRRQTTPESKQVRPRQHV